MFSNVYSATDAVEKVTAKHPGWLKPYKRKRRKATNILLGYLNDESSVTRTFALQALADLAKDDLRLRQEVIGLLKDATRSGTSAMKSRAKNLLKKLDA